MARKAAGRTGSEPRDRGVEGAALEPVGKVQRKLVSPAGEVVVVEVPVYPPFRLKTEAERESTPG